MSEITYYITGGEKMFLKVKFTPRQAIKKFVFSCSATVGCETIVLPDKKVISFRTKNLESIIKNN